MTDDEVVDEEMINTEEEFDFDDDLGLDDGDFGEDDELDLQFGSSEEEE